MNKRVIPMIRLPVILTGLVAAIAIQAAGRCAAAARNDSTWSYYGGSHRFDRYSGLDQINASNVAKLRAVWKRGAIDPTLLAQYPDLAASAYFRGTPLVIDGILYAPNGVGLVEAFDGSTGRTVWVQQPFEPTMQEAAGSSSRGIDSWRKHSDLRIFVVRGDWLCALDGRSGAYFAAFGNKGRVSLRRQNPENTAFWGVNGPIVVGDVVIVSGAGGGNAGDVGVYKEAAPEDVRGFDVHTGRLLWTFHVMPQSGNPARLTWGRGSADYSGNMGAWASMAADDRLGIVYLPLSSVTNAFYGGHRPGDNLYSNSIVALDARSGRLLWHRQLVHHDLWDYDNASPPVLGEINVNGKRIDAVFQANKSGYLYAFERRTGRPVWPIMEQPVPASNVPGEQASPTQPVPTRPPAFDRQTLTPDDLIDFTPQLHAEALGILDRYIVGGLFTPPSLLGTQPNGKRGTLTLPGSWGAANWNNGAFDPSTGIYYAISTTVPSVLGLATPPAEKSTIRYAWTEAPEAAQGAREHSEYGIGPSGLPLLKPPYGRITALDMNQGTKLWTVANGDGPRNHPLLKHLNLPALGNLGRPVPLVTKTLLFLGEGSDAVFGESGVAGATQFRAYDKRTGSVIGALALPAGTTGGPITYSVHGRQFIVVPVGNKTWGGGWVALALTGDSVALDATQNSPAALQSPAFPVAQIERGRKLLNSKCVSCHGENGSEQAPRLAGDSFWSHWRGQSARSLYAKILSSMPLSNPGSLTSQEVIDLVAALLGTSSESAADVSSPEALARMSLVPNDR